MGWGSRTVGPSLGPKILVLKMAHPRYARVCIIHRINMTYLPRQVLFLSVSEKNYFYIETNVGILRHRLQNLYEF